MNLNQVFKSILIQILFVCSFCVSSLSAINIPSTYSIATISGNIKIIPDSVIRGVYLPHFAVEIENEKPESTLVLKWKGLNVRQFGKYPALRLCLVSDLVSFQWLEVSLPDNRVVGKIDLSLGNSFQLVQLAIPSGLIKDVLKQGVVIRLRGKGDAVRFFSNGEAVTKSMLPHLLTVGNQKPIDEFLNRMASRSSVTAYGWEEGCVVDGLAMLSKFRKDSLRFKNALNDHLKLLFPKDNAVNHASGIFSMEETACIAQLAFKNPYHPDVNNVFEFWNKKKNESGMINDGTTVVAEGNYTVAWPLAVLGKQLNRPDLTEEAIRQLRHRVEYLVDKEGAIWLRNNKGNKTYRLWNRGNAWYLLGMVKTLDIMDNPPADLIAEVKRACAFLAPLQDEEGMWHVFAGEATTTAPESSGTSGIAAAMAISMRRGWIDNTYKPIVQKAYKALQNRLTPDGYLDGVSQSNKWQGGEKFQRATKGTTCQWGMGMFAQLIAEINE